MDSEQPAQHHDTGLFATLNHAIDVGWGLQLQFPHTYLPREKTTTLPSTPVNGRQTPNPPPAPVSCHRTEELKTDNEERSMGGCLPLSRRPKNASEHTRGENGKNRPEA